MRVRVNGEEREAQNGSTLKALLDGLNIRPESIAVEVNREIVPKRTWENAVLKDGDVIEIVRMTGGG
ncbi:MAG: thiamine biosynthesis protein ThiS [Deltaproteobacteria bacterium GWC2_56_8]|nr:MAG: thiamine biosynthesis protein ThiS [Deltaproteobacteria bacterium GWB2_55_19]OGP38509.1 MAG: thiamine biosynthesis protein ThiS [Deltaproteobacteria bacterium GWC2_56_8]HAO93135.1 thiamine biosynthesis protein ThiS [Deltaproteobacteria bacterium]